MKEVGIRELRDHLSQYLKEVKQGDNLTITDRGKPVAQLIPAEMDIGEQAIGELLKRGDAKWGGGKPSGSSVTLNDGPEVSEYVIDDRR